MTALESAARRSCPRVPEPDCVVVRCRGEELAVRKLRPHVVYDYLSDRKERSRHRKGADQPPERAELPPEGGGPSHRKEADQATGRRRTSTGDAKILLYKGGRCCS